MTTSLGRQPAYTQIYKGVTRGADMAKFAASKWAEIKSHIQDMGLETRSRYSMADRYVRACTEYHFLYPLAVKEGAVKRGPNGGDLFSMRWAACDKLNDRILKFEEALLISPKAAEGKLSPPIKTKKDVPATKWLAQKS